MNPSQLTSEDIIHKEIQCSKEQIRKHQAAIQKAFEDLGIDGKVKITVGPELEMTAVAGPESYNRRAEQLVSQGGPGGQNFYDDSYMPPEAQVNNLSERLAPKPNSKRRNPPIKVELEPAMRLNQFTEYDLVPDHTGEYRATHRHGAMSGMEFIFPPYEPIKMVQRLKRVQDGIIKRARQFGLERMDTRTLPHKETLPNSIHLNSVIWVDGENAFSRQKEAEQGKPSELLLCVGLACRDYLRHSMFLFARAETDYARFQSDQRLAAPFVFGMMPRKHLGRFGFAMFRGEGRKTERAQSADADRPDPGDLRFEFRVPSTGAAGHPNTTAYPSQMALGYEMMEAYMHILANGVALWKERQLARRRGEQVPELNEEMLLPDEHDPFHYPQSKKEALELFQKSKEAMIYWKDRVPLLLQLSEEQDRFNELDYAVTTPDKGPHVNRHR